jgi:hypothetical protein
MVEYLGVLAAACWSNFGQLPWKCRTKKTSITQWAIPYSPSKPNVLCVARPHPKSWYIPYHERERPWPISYKKLTTDSLLGQLHHPEGRTKTIYFLLPLQRNVKKGCAVRHCE